MSDEMTVAGGERGTALWAYRSMKADALPALMNDLLVATDDGIEVPQCDAIKIALGKMVNVATGIPDGSLFRQAIWRVMQDFEETYHSWNEPKGPSSQNASHRRQQLIQLRKLRHSMARKSRKHGYIIAKNLDLRLMEDLYESLGVVVKTAPETFGKLAEAVARFYERK